MLNNAKNVIRHESLRSFYTFSQFFPVRSEDGDVLAVLDVNVTEQKKNRHGSQHSYIQMKI